MMNDENIPLRFPTQDSIEYLNQLFKLDENRFYSQDWEIELADPDRVAEFIDAYENLTRNDDDKFALMALIVCSFEDSTAHGIDEAVWKRIKNHLLSDFQLHQYTIAYWCCADTVEELGFEEAWTITPLMWEVWREGTAT